MTSDRVDAHADLHAELGVDIDPELLALALTHRSYAFEHGGIPTNERLEFLGDTILGQAITIELFDRHPDLSEGELAKRRAGVVSTVALAEVARRIGLGRHLLLGRGEETTGGRDKSSILADALEAIFGAAYLSLGHEASAALVLRLVGPLLDDPERSGAALDPKTHLQELSARLDRGSPEYAITATGPDHARTFTATVRIDGEAVATGEGTSKKAAEMSAALTAWTMLHDGDADAAVERG
ncbi:ribonuclease III [Agrococcus sp. SGAir0287]|uniref:ribonuclease III n=1 Tax=Agrococcus sp. SGAir0287 TaxID=2070347 RepID=UPI0010CCD465|nr:ribonuclease III [Agrococcus sp. SGAir0287]QCR18960.1 ribonuclease III [Agrococcus sp. SGAir0287]